MPASVGEPCRKGQAIIHLDSKIHVRVIRSRVWGSAVETKETSHLGE